MCDGKNCTYGSSKVILISTKQFDDVLVYFFDTESCTIFGRYSIVVAGGNSLAKSGYCY